MTTNNIKLNLFEEIVEGTKEVFSTMLMVELEEGVPVYENNAVFSSNLTSMIGLGGGIRGMLAVHCPEIVAKNITSGFLGMNVEELDEDVMDAIGEIANMVAGALKTSFHKCEIDIQLAIPTVVIGSSFKTSGFSGAYCISVPFSMNGERFWIEMKYILN